MEIKISSPSRRQNASVTAIGIKLNVKDESDRARVHQAAAQLLRRIAAMCENDDDILDVIDYLEVIEDNNDEQLYLGLMLDEQAATAGAVANQLMLMNKFARRLQIILNAKDNRELAKRVRESLNPQLPTTFLLTLLPFEYHTKLICIL